MTQPVPGADQRALASMANQVAEMQRQIDLLKMGNNQAALGFSSIEDGSLVIYDANGDPRVVIGKQDDGTYVGGTSPTAASPPEVPNPPVVTPGFTTLKVASKGSSDPPWPRDFSHLNVYLSQGTGAEGDPITAGELVGTIIGTTDSAFIIADLEPKPYRVWLTSVNNSGAESDASPAVTATPKLVVEQDILDGAITELKLNDDAVTQAKLAANSVGSIQIQGEVIDVTKLADGSVSGDKIIANAIAAGHLAAASVTSLALAAKAVQAENIAVGAIQAGHLAVDSVTAAAITSLAITSDKIAANAITAGHIQAGAITADKIRAGEVIADVTLETGTSGRRVSISGPGNEIRFYPQVGETAYGRLFSYVNTEYPDDITVELRAIDSDEVNVLPRLFLTPDSAFVGITDLADETVGRGGRMQLEESSGTFGVKTTSGDEYGLTVYDDGVMRMRGLWTSYYQPKPTEGVWTFSISYTNNESTTSGVFGLHYGLTMAHPMAPVLSAGDPDGFTTDILSFRDEANSLTGFVISCFGKSGGTGLHTGETVKIRGWVFGVDAEQVGNN